MDEYFAHARRELGPRIASTAHVLTISPGDRPEDIDPKIALELGYTILLGKPIIAVGWTGRAIPPGLRRIAATVIELQHDLGTPAGQQELMARLATVLGDD